MNAKSEELETALQEYANEHLQLKLIKFILENNELVIGKTEEEILNLFYERD